jgi:hypothetical protein
VTAWLDRRPLRLAARETEAIAAVDEIAHEAVAPALHSYGGARLHQDFAVRGGKALPDRLQSAGGSDGPGFSASRWRQDAIRVISPIRAGAPQAAAGCTFQIAV